MIDEAAVVYLIGLAVLLATFPLIMMGFEDFGPDDFEPTISEIIAGVAFWPLFIVTLVLIGVASLARRALGSSPNEVLSRRQKRKLEVRRRELALEREQVELTERAARVVNWWSPGA